MSVGLCHKRGDITVKPFRLLQYCSASLMSQTKTLHIFYRRSLNRLRSFTIFPLFSLSQTSAPVRQLSKQESAAEVRYLAAVLFALLTLTALFGSYIFRSYDDNRLTSWQWVFTNNQIFITGLILVVGLLMSWRLTEIRLSQKNILVFLLSSSFMA